MLEEYRFSSFEQIICEVKRLVLVGWKIVQIDCFDEYVKNRQDSVIKWVRGLED